MSVNYKYLQSKERLLRLIKQLIPEFSNEKHKGLRGRIGIVGGSREYTGAPYFAGISALKTGCDLSYVFCATEAAVPIKCYSPELIVLPVLSSADDVKEMSTTMFDRLHALVIGPGLGRDKMIADNVKIIIKEARRKNVPLVIDADGLHVVTTDPDSVKGYNKAILTPNVVEFKRLYDSVIDQSNETSRNVEDSVFKLAQVLGCTVVKKGPEDIISDGVSVVTCDSPGSLRRCGGQGDLLSGSLGTFAAWASQMENNVQDGLSIFVVASLASCLLTRKCNSLAYEKSAQAMITSEMISEIGIAFSSLFINDDKTDKN